MRREGVIREREREGEKREKEIGDRIERERGEEARG